MLENLASAGAMPPAGVPYFTNSDGSAETVDIEITIRSNGSLAVTLAAQQADPNSMTPDGLVQLHYDLPGGSAIDLLVSTLEIAEVAGVWQLALSGSFALTTAGIDWPTIDIKGLRIDSKGHISIDGGWISLPSQTAIDFAGFHVALEQLGFGTDSSGHRWVGFSGGRQSSGRHLARRIRPGAAGRPENWCGVLQRIGIDFAIPDVISFTGEIDHVQVTTAADLPAYGLPITGAVAVDPGLAGQIIHELEELGAALEARADWFATLQPLTRYTLDVVGGPLGGATADSSAQLRTRCLPSSCHGPRLEP